MPSKQLFSLALGITFFATTIFAQTTTPFIKIDQFGYFPNAKKVAVINDPQSGYNAAESFSPSTGASQYQIRRVSDNLSIFLPSLAELLVFARLFICK